MLSEVTKSYQGFTKTVNKNAETVRETWHGFKDVISGYVEGFNIGQNGTYGELTNIQFTCQEGPIWKAQLTWEKISNGGSSGYTSPEDNYGPQRSTLTTRQNQMPLETHKNYKLNWNHFLIWKVKEGEDPSTILGQWFIDAGLNDAIPEAYIKDYRIVKNRSEIPEGWDVVGGMEKAGVEYYFIPYYELTQIGTHARAQQAAWAVSNIAGKIATPTMGDFGIVNAHGGDWLCEGANVQFDGEYWVAQCTYTWSPEGWDVDLYDEAEEE